METGLIKKFRYSGPVQKLLKKRNNVANTLKTIAGRQQLFEVLSANVHAPIVFLGDSITALCEWRELLGWDLPILNRGIGGDTSAGVLSRIRSVTDLRPSAVFLMIGTNDLGLLPPATIASNISAILSEIRRGCPDTLTYLQSILPSRSIKRNRWAQEVNMELSKFADGQTIRYLSLYDCLLDNEDLLDSRFTHDGLHLSGDGYLKWAAQIQSHIEDLLGQNAFPLPGRHSDRLEELRPAV